ncbi:Rib/alpha-like domain-containing protein [Lactobacillus sp. ESL0791]|uniref:Rib/alpha-like domain-containing protein n=1 Tax=Lactobacillus sp. ESL0791 TaxID=2983234 RepID=UPI0023F6FA71|nr:Rib/alpha-like domain-containing protein [Lactobacillus sp. ESL0791]MDF7639201.1 Rib/alpha-like domain-containing protein [Lactobacillus sp. ESL0791]
MFGKNNFDEKLRRMEMQAKKDRFSIRKLAIGAASVLLGFSFMGAASQTAKADTLAAGQQQTVVANKQVNAKDVANKPKLSTFSGLSAFLRGGSEEESSASEGSTASQASEASSASSSSESESSSSSQASESSQGSSTSQASTGSTASQASQASSAGSEASAASTGSVSSDGAQKIKTTHANDIVIHHLLVDADGNKTTTPVKGLGDEKGDTYIDGYVGDTKTISATDPEQAAPDGYKIVTDQKSVTWTFVKDQNKEITFYYQMVPTIQSNDSFSKLYNNKVLTNAGAKAGSINAGRDSSGQVKLAYFNGLNGPNNVPMTNFGDITSSGGNTTDVGHAPWGMSVENRVPIYLVPGINIVKGDGERLGWLWQDKSDGNDYPFIAGINNKFDGATTDTGSNWRLWSVTQTPTTGLTNDPSNPDRNATITLKTSGDFKFGTQNTYTLDITMTLKPIGNIVDYSLNVRNVTAIDHPENPNPDLPGLWVGSMYDTDLGDGYNGPASGTPGTATTPADKVPFFYTGANQGLYLKHDGYKLKLDYTGKYAPTGWAAGDCNLGFSNVNITSPSSLGQKTATLATAAAADTAAFDKDSDSAVLMIWNGQDLPNNGSRNLGFQITIDSESAVVPSVTTDKKGDNYTGHDYTVTGKVTSFDTAPEAYPLRYFYEIDGDSNTTTEFTGPSVTTAGTYNYSVTIPSNKLTVGDTHQVSIFVEDQYGNYSVPASINLTANAEVKTKDKIYYVGDDFNKYDGFAGGMKVDTSDMTSGDISSVVIQNSSGQTISENNYASITSNPDKYTVTYTYKYGNGSKGGSTSATANITVIPRKYITINYIDQKGNAILANNLTGLSGNLTSGKHQNSYGSDFAISPNEILPGNHSYSYVNATDVSGNAIDLTNIKFDSENHVINLVYKTVSYNNTPITVHVIDNPSGAEKIPEFVNQAKWSSYLDNLTSNATSVEWVNTVAEKQAILSSIGQKSAKIKVNYDNANVILDNIKLNVVGAEPNTDAKANSMQSLDPDAGKYLSDDSKGKISPFKPTYHYIDDKGNETTTPPVFDASKNDANGKQTLHIKVDYDDETSQTVDVPISVESQASQNHGNVFVKNDEANPIKTHVNAKITNDDLKGLVVIGSLVEGKDYSLSWGSTVDTSDTGLNNGEKNTKYAVKITYADKTIDTADVWVDVAGATDKGNPTIFNSGRIVNKDTDDQSAKDAVDSSKVSGWVDKFSWAADAGNTTALSTKWNETSGQPHAAYVIVHYLDGTTQAVKTTVQIDSQSEEAAGRLRLKQNFLMHINQSDARQDLYLDAAHRADYFEDTAANNNDNIMDKIASMVWTTRPNVSVPTDIIGNPDHAGIISFVPDTTGVIKITFKDGSILSLPNVATDVLGARPNSDAVAYSMAYTIFPVEPAAYYLNSLTVDRFFKSNCKFLDNGKEVDNLVLNAKNNDSSGKQMVHIKVTYGDDGSSQIVNVPVKVIPMNESQHGRVHADTIKTHVNADPNNGLADAVKIGQLVEGTNKDYSLSWSTNPDLTANGLDNGEKGGEYPVKITYGDNSTDTVNVRVDVVGASGRAGNELNSGQPVPTDSDSLGNYLNTGTISNWSPTYSLVKADGTPATNSDYNTTWTSGSHESEDIYIKVMYHKPGSGITGAEDGFQIVKVTIGLRQPPTPVTPVVITPKGGMVFVKRGQRLTAIEAQRAISNHEELDKANANYSWVTPLPNTQMLGSKIGHVRVFYKGQTTIVMVTVVVTN